MQLDKNNSKNKEQNDWLRLALTVFAETTGWIAFPVVGALFLGRYLDERQGTEPLYFLSITASAFIISSIGIARVGIKYMKQIEEAEGLERSREKELKKQKVNDSRNGSQQSR